MRPLIFLYLSPVGKRLPYIKCGCVRVGELLALRVRGEHSALPLTHHTVGVSQALLRENTRKGPTSTSLNLTSDTDVGISKSPALLLFRQTLVFEQVSAMWCSCSCRGKWFYSVGLVTLAEQHSPQCL